MTCAFTSKLPNTCSGALWESRRDTAHVLDNPGRLPGEVVYGLSISRTQKGGWNLAHCWGDSGRHTVNTVHSS